MTTLQFYNSLTKKKEVFEPITPGQAGLYSCGPTVYDHVHIGNLRAFITADTLQRTLRHIGGLKTKWVMNITDIDDKMITRSCTEYPNDEPGVALSKLAQEYSAKFLEDLKAVGIKREDIAELPVATEHIPGMQELIRQLLEENIAYIADGSVYFSLSKYEESGKDYGQLVNVEYDAQARIDDQDQKAGAGDFALWKAAKEGEPAWDFDVNGVNLSGRPGWHIECSVMSTQYLGKEFDLHTGGIDLKFPHHENEIAQCGGVLARYWLHNEFLNVETEKMSKSLGNFVRLTDIGGDPLALRLLILSAHYRSRMDYSAASLAEAGQRRLALKEWASKVVNNEGDGDAKVLTKSFDTALADDLGTPAALAVIAEAERSGQYGAGMKSFIHHLDDTLGLQLLDEVHDVKSGEVAELLSERAEVRQKQDWTTSDALRDKLNNMGIGVEDTTAGQIVWQISNK